MKNYRIWRYKSRTAPENITKLPWVCVSLTACLDWGLQGMESAVFGVCSKSQILFASTTCTRQLFKEEGWLLFVLLCMGTPCFQGTLEIHHWSKPLSFKSFGGLFSYDTCELLKITLCTSMSAVCARGSFGGLWQFLSAGQELWNCARKYIRLPWSPSPEEKKKNVELSVHLWWVLCSHTLVKTTGPKKALLPWDHHHL